MFLPKSSRGRHPSLLDDGPLGSVQGLMPWSSSAAVKQKNAYYEHDDDNKRRVRTTPVESQQHLARAAGSRVDLEQLVKVTIH